MSAPPPARPAAALDRQAGTRRRGERLLGLLAAGIVALNYPLLSIFSDAALVGGIPALYLYLFAVWTGIIGATALVLRRGRGGRPGAGPAREP